MNILLAEKFLDEYSRAFKKKEREKLLELMALEDPRFCEFDETAAYLLTSDHVKELLQKLHLLEEPYTEFTDTQVHTLSENISLITATQYIEVTEQGQRVDHNVRVSLIMLRIGENEEKWKILHGHFSSFPE